MVDEKKGEYDANIKKASDGRGETQKYFEERLSRVPAKGESGKKKGS